MFKSISESSKLNVLVTGGLGYIGSHVYCSLVDQNISVDIVDNLSNSSKSVTECLKKISKTNPNVFIEDISNKDALDSICSNKKYDAIIHCAGNKSVPESIIQPEKYLVDNINLLKNVLFASKKYKIKNLIFSSTAAVYKQTNQAVAENSILEPLNPYSISKLECEKMIKRFAKDNDHFAYIIFRYFNPIGAHRSGLIGDNPIIDQGGIISAMRNAINSNDNVKIFGSDYPTIDGTPVRDFLHIEDLAYAHLLALEKLRLFHFQNEIFNIGTGNGCSVMQLIEKYYEVSKAKSNFVFSRRRESDIYYSVSDVTKLKKSFNFIPSKSIEEMCKSDWVFFEKNIA